MATWNGMDPEESQDPNYYYYCNQNSHLQNWQYYAQNSQTPYYNNPPSNSAYYQNYNNHYIPEGGPHYHPEPPREKNYPHYQAYHQNRNAESNYKYSNHHQRHPNPRNHVGQRNETPDYHFERKRESRQNFHGNYENAQSQQQNHCPVGNKHNRNYNGGSGRFHSDRHRNDTYNWNSNQYGRSNLAGPSSEERSRRNYNRDKEENRNVREYEDQRLVRSENFGTPGRKWKNSEERVAGGNKSEKYQDKSKEQKSKYINKEKQHHLKNRESKFERKLEKREVAKEREEESTNWRQKSTVESKPSATKKKVFKDQNYDDDASQRERLTDQLNRGRLECLVCCESIRQTNSIWSCSNCYHVLHLKCVEQWAKVSKDDNGWRCPACQNISISAPEDVCFCGKMQCPEWNRNDMAHSCGDVCKRSRTLNDCVHKCTLLCHPGACQPCFAMVTRSCGCKKTSQSVKCSSTALLLCEQVCDQILNCEKHKCAKKCHHGSCGACEEKVKQVCFCGEHSREVSCEKDTPLMYCCGNICNKLLNCNNHNCTEICHEGPCKICPLNPDIVTHCCCQQTLLADKRSSCFDPVPTCDKICSKPLPCGQPSNPHKCKANCHTGDCPKCELTTMVRCRCGHMDKEISCMELVTKADDARCEKKCTKKRDCGKHKCNQMCCIEIDHFCPLPCSKTLSCGRHKCEQTCHSGRCQPCYRSSFEELYCECNTEVIYPPVPCGTKRPSCEKPCSRRHACGHEVLHTCHSNATCPPCAVLTQRLCYCKHELRKAVPCYIKEISCGRPCNKPLPCGKHNCKTLCHAGSCVKQGQTCTQPCTVLRETCGHICGAPCHDSKCRDHPCKEIVKVSCPCGHLRSSRICSENYRDYQRIATGILASKMADIQLGHASINLSDVFNAKKQNQLKTLECNEECKTIERNRRLAVGLQIANPDLSGKPTPRYSDNMKLWAKKDPKFCQMVHDKLTELVQMSKNSKLKSRSHSFECMNRDKRCFVYEACEIFGCESQAYDQEPNRNIVATAVKDKCWLPSYSLLEFVQRENGQRKVPGPVLKNTMALTRGANMLPLNSWKSQKP